MRSNIMNRTQRIDKLLSQKQPTLQVMLDGVHSSQNLSAIVRSCDAVGVLDLYYSSKGDKTLKIHKTITQGAHRWVRQHRVNDVDKIEFLRQQQRDGYQVIASSLTGTSVSPEKIDYTLPTIIVMGNEQSGVSPEVVELANSCVMIPMFGMVQSLNVSVATALLLYEAQQQRSKAKLYDTPQLSIEERDKIKESWLYRDTIARRSKGQIPALCTDELVLDKK